MSHEKTEVSRPSDFRAVEVSPSRTRPPRSPRAMAVWRRWTDIPIEHLGWIALDSSGRPITSRRIGGGR